MKAIEIFKKAVREVFREELKEIILESLKNNTLIKEEFQPKSYTPPPPPINNGLLGEGVTNFTKPIPKTQAQMREAYGQILKNMGQEGGKQQEYQPNPNIDVINGTLGTGDLPLEMITELIKPNG